MGDIGEYYQEQRNKSQAQKAKNLKWNTDVVLGYAVEYDFEVKQHTEYHFSLTHPTLGRFDYWPSTSKGMWFHNINQKYGRAFHIEDIEAYLMKHFQP